MLGRMGLTDLEIKKNGLWSRNHKRSYENKVAWEDDVRSAQRTENLQVNSILFQKKKLVSKHRHFYYVINNAIISTCVVTGLEFFVDILYTKIHPSPAISLATIGLHFWTKQNPDLMWSGF